MELVKKYIFYWKRYNMVNYYWNNLFGSKQSSLSDFNVLVYHPVVFKQIISLKLILSQHNPKNWLYIGRWSIANMLHQYFTNIGRPYETNVTSAQWQANISRPNISRLDIANANIANGNSILSQFGLTRERQRQWETNVGPIYSC